MPASASCARADLASALKFVTAALPRRAPIAVLSGILIDTTGADLCHLAAFDYEISAQTSIACTGDVGRILVDGRAFADVIGKPAKGEASKVHLAADGSVLTVTTDDGATARLPLLALEDYPALPPAPARVLTVLSAADVAAMPVVALAAGRDDTLPVLTAIAFSDEMAATDRYRLSRYKLSAPTGEKALLIPASTCKLVAAHMVGDVTMSATDPKTPIKLVAFTDGVRTLTTRTLDGDYPRYRGLWPAESAGTVEVDCKALADTVAALAKLCERNAPVRLVRGGNVWQVEVGEDERRATRLVPATFEGDVPSPVAFTPKYLLDALGAVGRGPVRIAINSPVKPAVVTGTGPVRMLVMPVRLADDAA